MDRSPKINTIGPHYKALVTPNLMESSLSVTSLGEKNQFLKYLKIAVVSSVDNFCPRAALTTHELEWLEP